MSIYSQGQGWRYDFTLAGQRFTSKNYKTKAEARQAEAQKREELKNPPQPEQTPTDTAFLELVNRRLDHVKAYNSERHYEEYVYVARRWIKRWGKLQCSQITPDILEAFILQRNKVSAYTANKEIRYLRATFRFGVKKHLVELDPTREMDFLPVEKRIKYVPSLEDIEKVMAMANDDTRDYLRAIQDTMARVSEINALCWDDIDLQSRTVVLYTRKKKGGHRTPRVVPMTERLHAILARRFQENRGKLPWVFWHRYWDKTDHRWTHGPYRSRHNLMRCLCERAGVRRFGFHALRHAGASMLDMQRVPIGTIQRILGHENRSTTEIYLHSMGEPEREAMRAFEQAAISPASGACVKNPHINPHIDGDRRLRLKLVKG